MTNEQAIKWLKDYIQNTPFQMEQYERAFDMAIQALSQEPTVTSTDEPMTMVYPTIVCDDAISRILKRMWNCRGKHTTSIDKVAMEQIIRDELPSVTQKSGKCKNCKYFEYDSMAKVDGVPLIVAHEICNKWGDGCKTNEDGYCFLFEPQESEARNERNSNV